MTTSSKILWALIVAFTPLLSCLAQIKNAKIETVKVYGNCGMCQTTIELAGNVKKVAKVDWNTETKMATLTYDNTKTNQDEILKRIALAGYDSDKFLAPDDAYNKLHGCCQYERVNKKAVVQTEVTENNSAYNHGEASESQSETKQEVNQLKTIFDNYFLLKDALVQSDGKLATSITKELLLNISIVRMDKLTSEAHAVWMKVMENLKANAEKIYASSSPEMQRKSFDELSENFYELAKVSDQESPIYYQNCPMYNDGEGAIWLSRESAVKNPYYGSQMLTCGKTVETIK